MGAKTKMAFKKSNGKEEQNDGLEMIDGMTGEVMSNASMLALSPGEWLKLAKKANDLKSSELQEKEPDWWDPKAQGAEQTLRGVYLGSQVKKQRVEHAVGQLSKKYKNKGVIVRFNGSTQITQDLRQVKPGTIVEVTFNGKVPTKSVDEETGMVYDRNDYTLKTFETEE